MTTATAHDLDRPYSLSDEQIAFFRKEGYIKLKQVLSPEQLKKYGERITEQVLELNTQHLPIEQRDTYSKAFLQVGNIWTHDAVVKEFVFGRRLARIATELLGTKGVRLYHDQALYKEPSGGISPWHVDQFYWPLESTQTVTAWIPLQQAAQDMGPLAFSARSQNLEFGRGLPISDESEVQIQEALTSGGYAYVEEPFDLGEVSFHYGFTYHRAGANTTENPRKVMTVIYMDSEMRAIEPTSSYQRNDLETWCDNTPPGQVIRGPLNPVLYEA